MTKPRLPPRPETELGRTKRRVFDLERRLAALTARSTFTPGGPFVTVAAANTPDLMKRLASFVAEASDDQDAVTEALSVSAATGGEVFLLPGDFYFTDLVGTSAWLNVPNPLAGFITSTARLHGSGDGTRVHFDGEIAFAQALDLADMSIIYEGDPLAARDGANVVNLYRVRFFDCRANAGGKMHDCGIFGTYAPTVTGYNPALDWVSSAAEYRGVRFAIVAPDFNIASIQGNTPALLDCVFVPALAVDSPMACRAVIQLGGSFDATLARIAGNRISMPGSVDPDSSLVEYGIRNAGGDPRGAIIEGNSFSIAGTDPVGFSDPTTPYIVGVFTIENDVTVRNNYAEGVGYLEEQGFGT